MIENGSALLLPLTIFVIGAALFYLFWKIDFSFVEKKNKYLLNILSILGFIIPIIIVLGFIFYPSIALETFVYFGNRYLSFVYTIKGNIFYLINSFAIPVILLFMWLVFFINFCIFLIRKKTWKELLDTENWWVPMSWGSGLFYKKKKSDTLNWEKPNYSTLGIISFALSDLRAHLTNYFFILIPAILASFAHIYYFLGKDQSYFYYTSFLLAYAFNVIAIVNIHRFIILKKEINLNNLVNNFTVYLKYYFYGLVLFIVGFAPIMASFFILGSIMDSLDYNSISLITIIVISIILLSISIFFLLFTYPFFAFLLPITSVGESAKLKEVWKLTKGYRFSLFLQFIIIWGVSEFLISILSFTENYTFGSESVLFFSLLYEFIRIIPFVLTISCLSKTYQIYKENQS